MLVLFDIDGTLLQTHGAGLKAMALALADLHGPREYSFEGVETSGRLDPHIWRDLCRLHELPQDEASHERFRLRYEHHLAERFRTDAVSRALPGTHTLVDRLHAEPSLTLGLLTGNYPVTGRLKVEHAGFETARFPIGAFAVDGPDRRSLPPVAMRRFAAHRGASIPAERVLIIGDTPLDIDCARANGCRCLAVATGRHPREELEADRPDRVVADLSDTDAILRWILDLGSDSR
jgi:phosphoglycolate phosphatase